MSFRLKHSIGLSSLLTAHSIVLFKEGMSSLEDEGLGIDQRLRNATLAPDIKVRPWASK